MGVVHVISLNRRLRLLVLLPCHRQHLGLVLPKRRRLL
jgi:hypothetical protein